LFPSHTYSAAGFYNICVTITVSCASTASACSNTNVFKTAMNSESNAVAVVNVKNLMTGIKRQDIEDASVKIFPNPNNGEFEIILSGMQNQKISEIKVYDLLGQEVYSAKETAPGNTGNKKLMLSGLSNGSYLVTVTSEERTFKSKIIITR
jgi:hypothetical protein